MTSKPSTPKRKRNGLHAEQIHEMQNLTPRAAAWLADVPASTLRDAAAMVPPDREGNYDAREVTKWINARRLSKVSDDDLEMIYRATEYRLNHGHRGPVGRVIKEMRAKYGRGADGWFVDILLEAAEFEGTEPPERYRRISDEELLARAKSAYARESNARSEERLDVAAVCTECGRLRKGSRWVKAKPRLDERTIDSICQDCATFDYADPFVVDIRDLMDS